MNRLSSLKWRLRGGVCLGLVSTAVCAVSMALGTAADLKPEKDQKPDKKDEKKVEQKSAADASSKKPKPELKRLTGSELYSMHCNRCHPERYPTERTAAQWKTILLHMRVRVNLPAEQARTILKYLQDNSGR